MYYLSPATLQKADMMLGASVTGSNNTQMQLPTRAVEQRWKMSGFS